MKKLLITMLIIILCLGGYAVSAQEVSQLSIVPCWYGEAYSIDCVYAVSGGGIDDVTSLLTGCIFDWNYIEEDGLLLIAAASANPLPDTAQLMAYMTVSADDGTTLKLISVSINGRETQIRSPGDVNGDGDVNDSDAELLNQYFSGHDVSVDASAADVDADCTLTRRDAMILSRHTAGWDGYSLPYSAENAAE